MNRKQKNAEVDQSHRSEDDPYETSQQLYVNSWGDGHAAHFASQRCYDWMGSFVKDRKLVLEIGIGTGAGTLALCKNGSRVVSIDHNPRFFPRASELLISSGIPVVEERRAILRRDQSDELHLDYQPVKSRIPEAGVLLLDADAAYDRKFFEWICCQKGFDAVVCWNIGSHIAEVRSHDSEQAFRMIVQGAAFAIAHRCLSPGGVLHIVDRAIAVTETTKRSVRDAFVSNHRRNLIEFTVDQDTQYLTYESPPPESGIKMTPADSSKTINRDTGFAFVSFLCRRI